MKMLILLIAFICSIGVQAQHLGLGCGKIPIQITEHFRDYSPFVGVFQLKSIDTNHHLILELEKTLHKTSPRTLCVDLTHLDSFHIQELNHLKIENHYIIGILPHDIKDKKYDGCDMVITLQDYADIGLFIIKHSKNIEELVWSGLQNDDDLFLTLATEILDNFSKLDEKQQKLFVLELYFRKNVKSKLNKKNLEQMFDLLDHPEVNPVAKKYFLASLVYNKKSFDINRVVEKCRFILDENYIKKTSPSNDLEFHFLAKKCISLLKHYGDRTDIERFKKLVNHSYQNLVGTAFGALLIIDKEYAIDFGNSILDTPNNHLTEDNRYWMTKIIERYSKKDLPLKH